MYEKITVEVTGEEYVQLMKMRNGMTWRELFLQGLGFDSKRLKSGPKPKAKTDGCAQV